jgi:hypothetical protein
MTNPDPEDEAFEELALKQGHWQHTSGWRKKQIMKTSTTKDEIDIMWQQAMKESIKNNEMYTRYHFAKLVAAKEREACAKVCETLWDTAENGMATEDAAYGNECATAIRARGQA